MSKRVFEYRDGKMVQVSGSPESASERETQQEKLADMLRARRAPRGMTDSTYFAGIYGGLAKQWGPEEAAEIRRDAARNYGKDPGDNCVYLPQLVPIGAAPGHPAAFVSLSDGVGEIKKRYRKQGKGSELLGIKAAEHIPTPDRLVAPDIVDEEVRNRVRENPGLKLKGKKLREEVKGELEDRVREIHK